MHEPFFTTEADEMSRAFDPSNTDAPPTGSPSGPAPEPPVDRLIKGGVRATGPASPSESTPSSPARRSISHLAVCPFCGSVNETTSGAACRHCGMENTPATRQATRSKIGPWFVWQSRNPSAPGMNWATLISLVEKGRITPRSVVRGPTTGQLWRFAARVKGLSREFGACWHCGGELLRTARLCTGCKRLQQPPINPDALLENGSDIAMSPVHKSVADPTHRGLLSLAPEPVRREATPPPAESPTPRTGLLDAPPPAGVPIDPSTPVIDMGEDALPSGMEFRAFQMEGDHDVPAPRKGTLRRILIAAFLTVLIVAPVLYLNPEVRAHYVRWYQQFVAWMKTPRTRAVVPTSATMPTLETNTDATDPSTSPPSTPLFSVPVFTPVDKPPEKKAAAPEPLIDIGPASKPTPIIPKPPDGDAVNRVEISPSEPKATERRSWELYERAIKSEQREDYSAAVQEYEWIEQLRLPEGSGPSDVESRLQHARQLQKQKSN